MLKPPSSAAITPLQILWFKSHGQNEKIPPAIPRPMWRPLIIQPAQDAIETRIPFGQVFALCSWRDDGQTLQSEHVIILAKPIDDLLRRKIVNIELKPFKISTDGTPSQASKREPEISAKDFHPLPQTDTWHEHPRHYTADAQYLWQLLDNGRKIRYTVESAQVRENCIERRARHIVQRKKRTFLPRDPIMQIQVLHFVAQAIQHSRRDIRCMDTISALRKLNRVRACACI